MKKLQKNFTTPEQSKKLQELGVPADSADCYFDSTKLGRPAIKILQIECDLIHTGQQFPCWSVGRLIEIISICFDHSKCALCYDLGGLLSVEDIIEETIKPNLEDGMLDFSKLEE